MKNAFERQDTIDQESVAREIRRITHTNEGAGEMEDEMKKATRPYDWPGRGINRMPDYSG